MLGIRWRLMIAAGLILAFIFVNNTSLFVAPPEGVPSLLAHRGVAQRFDTEGLTGGTCTAARMLPSGHDFIENTILSMKASFDAGADIVELDVHSTTDGQFAVFHDWTLECRTDGTGITRTHTMAELKALDVGYGYTADGGHSFPLRGTGMGLMPTLSEVLTAFPERRFLINIKSKDMVEARQLAAFLGRLAVEDRARLMVYGGGAAMMAELKRLQPDVPMLSKRMLKDCLARYVTYGWTGAMPSACEGIVLIVPINVAPWLWGWPNRFQTRFRAVGTEIFVLGPYHGGGFASGVDSLETLAHLPEGYSGGIWTDEIELIARHLKGTRSPG